MDEMEHGCLALAGGWLCCHWRNGMLRGATLRDAPCARAQDVPDRLGRLQALLLAQHRLALDDPMQHALASAWLDLLDDWLPTADWQDRRPAAAGRQVRDLAPGRHSMK